jgi:hypothetical protein
MVDRLRLLLTIEEIIHSNLLTFLVSVVKERSATRSNPTCVEITTTSFS